MKKQILFILLSISFGLTAQSQFYQVQEIEIIDNQTTKAYYEKVNSKDINLFSAFVKESISNEYSPFHYSFLQKDDKLIMQIKGDKGEFEIPLEKQKKGIFSKTSGNDSIVVDISKKTPALFIDKYNSLEKPEEQYMEEYKEMVKSYGQEVKIYRINLKLREISKEEISNQLDFQKAYKVNGVELIKDEKVLAFADEHVNTDFYTHHHKFSPEQLEDMFLGTVYKIDVEGRHIKINVSSDNMSNSSSSTLNKIGEGHYRAKALNSYYDFFVEPESEEPFKVKYIEYALFFPPKESYGNTEAYHSLREKYGEDIPYNIIRLSVEEVPIKNN